MGRLMHTNAHLQGITAVLEFPLSLTISVPAQIPNWSIVASLTSTLSKVRRSPLQVSALQLHTYVGLYRYHHLSVGIQLAYPLSPLPYPSAEST